MYRSMFNKALYNCPCVCTRIPDRIHIILINATLNGAKPSQHRDVLAQIKNKNLAKTRTMDDPYTFLFTYHLFRTPLAGCKGVYVALFALLDW